MMNKRCLCFSFISHLCLLCSFVWYFYDEHPSRLEKTSFLQTYLSPEKRFDGLRQKASNPPYLIPKQIFATTPLKSGNVVAQSIKSHDQTKQTPIILKILHEAIAAKQQYPEEALALKQTGTVKIGFWLHPDGQLENMKILKSSGFESIDMAAFTAIKAITPVKTISGYLSHAAFFSVDIVFE